MKLAVINFSGNVGKSTIARHLLLPRIPRCELIAVESINADDAQGTTVRGRQFAELQEFLQNTSNAVVDIGASNVEEMLMLMRRYQGSHIDFDGFIVPTVPSRKQQQDTAATLTELSRLGVSADRVRLVFNQVADDEPIQSVFETLLAYCAASKTVEPRLKAQLRYNELYAMLRGTSKSIKELAEDPTDYKALIAQAATTEEKLKLSRALGAHRLASGLLPKLDACFDALDLQSLIFEWSGANPAARPAAGESAAQWR